MEPLRRSGLVVERARGELLLRDVVEHRTYALNEAALAVFELCDGVTTPDEMVRRLSAEGLPGVNAEMVQLALHDLVELST